ncbi:MAG: hypothetical protein K6B39_06385 [Lachnospiraceae bacterium]|nr:hypothetical protein [Lachnospiraceae bacterium]MCR5087003.1 hypothetical protein [Lachnospiraceae bacterium]
MKGKLKAMFTRNIGMKLVSLVLALLVWITIINLSDPKITKTISDIPIDFRNEEVVTSENTTYVPSDSAGRKVTIRISGVRSKIEELTASDFIAYVDFNEMSSVYAVPVHVEAKEKNIAAIVEITRQSTMMMSGKIVQMETAVVSYSFEFANCPKGYYPVFVDADNKRYTVSGSQDVVKAGLSLVATVDLDGVNPSARKGKASLAAYDSDGNSIDLKDLGFAAQMTEVNVEFDLLQKQTVKINPISKDGIVPVNGYGIVEVETQKELLLAGKPQDMADLLANGFTIPYHRENVQGRGIYIEDNEFNYREYLPEGVYDPSEKYTIPVRIKVDMLQKKTLTVNATSVIFRDLESTFTAEIEAETLTVDVFDFAENLEKLTANQLDLYVDMKGIAAPGKYQVELHSDYANAQGDRSVETSLRKQEEPNQNPDGEYKTFSMKVNVVVTENSEEGQHAGA